MLEITSKVLIDGKSVDFTTASYKQSGGLSAAQLTVSLPGTDTSYRKYWGKEIIAYLNLEDTYPFFRGYVMDATIENEFSLKLIALDALGWLTGHQKATVYIKDNNNIDGLTIGAGLKKLISLANLDDTVGTDYIGDTKPKVTARNNVRGDLVILNWLKKSMGEAIDDSGNIPLENTLVVRDDGTKGQLCLELLSDVDTVQPSYTFYENNLIGYNVKARKMPTTIIVKGKNKVMGKYRHSSAAKAYGENFKQISNNNLSSPAACVNFGRMVFYANVENQYEISITTYEGVYLLPNDVIRLNIKNADVSGNYRVVGKEVTFSPSKFEVKLNINQRPPILSDFLV
tara:strand:- start:573 stop:1601 length:1029 start_codon:yes stop_codon:yes gene_type:complete